MPLTRMMLLLITWQRPTRLGNGLKVTHFALRAIGFRKKKITPPILMRRGLFSVSFKTHFHDLLGLNIKI